MSREAIIDLYRTEGRGDWAYYAVAEAEGGGVFWDPKHPFLSRWMAMNHENVLEVACGAGRHAANALKHCKSLHVMDTSEPVIKLVRERFAGESHVKVHYSVDGESLPFIENESLTAVYSYDAMVHFEVATIAAYLREFGRTLIKGGRALLHHSNTDDPPTRSLFETPGTRNYMNRSLMAHLAARGGLTLVEHAPIDWALPKGDAMSLLEKI